MVTPQAWSYMCSSMPGFFYSLRINPLVIP